MYMKPAFLCVLASLFAVCGVEASVILTQDGDGVYGVGEPIRFTIRDPDHKPFTARYVFKRGQVTALSSGDIAGGEAPAVIETSLDAPGTVLLEVMVKSGDEPEKRLLGGAVVAPGDIKPAAPTPDDFDAFWQAKIDELNAVPMNATLEPASPTTRPADAPLKLEYYKLTLDNVRGSKIHGQLARPAEGEKFPAILIVQWAGVYPLEKPWVTDRAREGWLALNINPHDLPIDEPAEFYKRQYEGPLRNYWAIGNDDRDTSYFLRMYLSCYRAVEYLASRPDWDGKTIVVIGASQGGMQALVTAGLQPKVTAAIACVPAGCDYLGETVERKSGWPQWSMQAAGKDPEKVHAASRYFDVVNFASRIRCPTYIAPGLIDEVCPPEGIFAAFNQISSPKQLLLMRDSDHQGTHNTQQIFYDTCFGQWLPALREGRDPGAK